MSFAELLRSGRRSRGLTQEELAERARISVRAISDLERGLKQAPRPSTARQLVEALELEAEHAARFLAAAQRDGRHSKVSEREKPGAQRLPRELSSFVGREQELIELDVLLETTPLLTLVGTGGVGKTRLALRLAGRVQSRYAGGA